MALRPDQQKVHTMLTESIMMLCRNGLEYTEGFSVEGLLGITLDKKEVFLVNIKESTQTNIGKTVAASATDQLNKGTTNSEPLPSLPFDNYPAENPFDAFPHGRVSQESSPSESLKLPSPSGIMSFPLTPMMQQFKSPFRRMRGRRKFMFGMGRGMGGEGCGRGLRRKFMQHQQRMMNAMMEAHHTETHPPHPHPMGGLAHLYDQEGGMPFPKRHHLSKEMGLNAQGIPDLCPKKSSDKNQTATPSKGNTVKVEPEDTSDNEAELTIDESRNLIDLGESSPSAEGSPWYNRLEPSPTPSNDTNETRSDIFEETSSGVEAALLERIKTAILKEDGFFVTTRMLCRRYSAYFKSQLVIEAMKQLTVPPENPAHIGVFKTLKEARFSKIFYKCPPERINPEQLRSCNISVKQYQQSFYSMPQAKGSNNWDAFVKNILEASPYGTMNPSDFKLAQPTNFVSVEDEGPETVDSMAEFELQQFIVHGEGCFTSTRILCRRLSKQYNKVEKVIRAMKAMTRKRADKHYVGEFARVSERTKIFYKCPPRLLGSEALALYGMTMDQYVRLFYTTPRPWDGSISNWDTYIENIAAAYPYPFSDLPLDTLEVSPDVADRIRSLAAASLRTMQVPTTSVTQSAATASVFSNQAVRQYHSSLERLHGTVSRGRESDSPGPQTGIIVNPKSDDGQASSLDNTHYHQLRTLLGQGALTIPGQGQGALTIPGQGQGALTIPGQLQMKTTSESGSDVIPCVAQQGAVAFPGQIENEDVYDGENSNHSKGTEPNAE